MTGREELIEKAAYVVAASHKCEVWQAQDWDIAEALVTADWRPPPSGDMIEKARQAARADERFMYAARAGAGGLHLLDLTLGVLADAGLLARPVSTDDATVERVARAIYDEDETEPYQLGYRPHFDNDFPRFEGMARAAIRAITGEGR